MINLVGANALEFDETTHIYKYAGMILPSVTQIMSPLSSQTYNSIPANVLAKAAERGTSVHEAIENFINYGVEDIEPEHQGYFDTFKQWWDENQPTDCTAELRIYHPMLMYAGTCDLICNINGKTTLIDYKTTNKVQNKLCCLQLEAYSQALKAHGLGIEDKIILHLSPNKYEAIHFDVKDSVSWQVFNALMTVHNYKQGL